MLLLLSFENLFAEELRVGPWETDKPPAAPGEDLNHYQKV